MNDHYLKYIFDNMIDNYQLSKKLLDNHKSFHWDVFPKDYEKTIMEKKNWKSFLRNPISLGFNDDLIDFENTRWAIKKDINNINALERKYEHDFRDIIPETIVDKNKINSMSNSLKIILSITGIDFVLNNLQSNIGSPTYLAVKLEDLKSQKTINIKINQADLGNIYYFYQISKALGSIKNNSPVVAEIGSGYGGLISKLKKKYPNSKCVLFDLPELNCVQTYYLNQEFPKAKIYYYKDYLKYNDDIFMKDFDFLILPGEIFNKLPNEFLDIVINVRSMMEMKVETIQFYFDAIHRSLKEKGLFACFNRYIKNSSGEKIILKNYPFDEYWSIEISQNSAIQNHIHDLILRRNFKEQFKITEKLKSLPPY